MILNGVEYAYLRNVQNDIVGLLDSSGNQVVYYTYSTWGEVLSVTGSLASTLGAQNPYRYRGYRLDSETGLYYLQSRYYNPQWGRFLNADSQINDGIQGVKLFVYCNNNPANMVDETGLKPYDLFKTIDEAAADFGVYSNPLTDQDGLERGAFILRKFVFGKGIRYYYSDVFIGEHDNVANEFTLNYTYLLLRKPFNILLNTISFVHTHPNCNSHDGENFSPEDLALTLLPGIASVYLSTPNGFLYKVSKFGKLSRLNPIRSSLPIMKIFRYY